MLRDKASHEQHCALLQGDTMGHVSKEYGINRNSVLNELSYFHVCSGSLLPDVMHDLLEGALQYEMKLLLQFMIDSEQYFTLEKLNSRLENVELGYMECKDKPTLISVATLHSTGNSLKQKGICIYVHVYGERIALLSVQFYSFQDYLIIIHNLFTFSMTTI